MKENRDRAVSITANMVRQAGENLILRRETHIDQLVDKLKEERVFRVIDPMLRGLDMGDKVSQDDIQYVVDLGLIRRDKGLRPSNAIYREVIPREIMFVQQLNFESTYYPERYTDEKTGMLDMKRLMSAFQEFFRENLEHWMERFQYKEAGPQLLMQAFFQNIVNMKGRVEREYGFGRKRTDLLVIHPHRTGIQKAVIELKIRYGNTEETIKKGLEQTWGYMDRCGTEEGHLVIFDRRKNTGWDEKIFCRAEEYKGHKITVWGM